ncbi:HlyD family efflux transporter periplasmic adaptor subunit [Ahrensia kielensis]|uniref:HlyD family efflux transporter periplasmic adaptor subunit n=1 Tax=Ahrensia kielensis TaxID=76980 RepID=UPI00035CE44A|nr:HlyD family efflux transporter periplasmic adaptor subunit [Ahrensia kielensis]
MIGHASHNVADFEESLDVRQHHWIIRLIAIVFVVGIAWAYFATLDEVTTADGIVIPIRNEQVIQSLEGGLVRELNVRADEVVEAGEVLVRLDPTRLEAAVEEITVNLQAHQARIARLNAEVDNKPLAFEPSLRAYPDLVQTEKALYEARLTSLQTSLRLIEESRKLMQEELATMTRLRKIGASSRIELLRLNREIVDLNIREDDIKHDYYVRAREELSTVKSEAGALVAELRGRQDQLTRVTLRSPVRGIVKDITVSTVGGVVPPNGQLMTIVPLDDELLVEARVQPSDIAFIRPGLPATVKVTAYDYSVYGTLEGEVLSISPDSIRDEIDPERLYYRVFVRSENFELKNKAGQIYPITPGMVTAVDIHTGSKTVLQYLVKPFNRASEALRER